jgi:hypothetical protein
MTPRRPTKLTDCIAPHGRELYGAPIGIYQCTNDSHGRGNLTQQFKPLGVEFYGQPCVPGYIPSGAIETRNQATLYRIGHSGKYNRDRGGR